MGDEKGTGQSAQQVAGTNLLERQGEAGRGAAKDVTPAKTPSESLTPEDRILNAMAGLMEQAGQESPEHREAVASAGAKVAEAIKEIKELDQKSPEPRKSVMFSQKSPQEKWSVEEVEKEYAARIGKVEREIRADGTEHVLPVETIPSGITVSPLPVGGPAGTKAPPSR